jgi:hypothetical protein
VRQRPADVGCCREVGGEDAVALKRFHDSAHAKLVELALQALPERCDLLVGGRGLADDLGHVRGPLAHDAGVVGDEREPTPRVGLVDDVAKSGALGKLGRAPRRRRCAGSRARAAPRPWCRCSTGFPRASAARPPTTGSSATQDPNEVFIQVEFDSAQEEIAACERRSPRASSTALSDRMGPTVVEEAEAVGR